MVTAQTRADRRHCGLVDQRQPGWLYTNVAILGEPDRLMNEWQGSMGTDNLLRDQVPIDNRTA